MAIKVEGLREMEKALQAMATSTAKRTVRRAMEQALQPVKDHAKAVAPDSGYSGRYKVGDVNITSSLTKSQRREARRTDEGKHVLSMYVGSRGPHAHLVEFGTGPRYHKKSGKFVGAMPPQPFMRPAWDANKEQVLAVISELMFAEIEKTLGRAARAQANAARRAARAARG